MRELKFRAWYAPEKEYIYDVQATYDNACEGRGSIYHESFREVLEDEDCAVEQYTGLKDKNGKEIYEGDIVRWSFKVDRNSKLTHTTDAVKWESYEEEEWPYSTVSGFTLAESEDGYEVIGNIHENPELSE